MPTVLPVSSPVSIGCQRRSRCASAQASSRLATRSIMAITYWAIGWLVVPAELVSTMPRSTSARNAGWSTPALKEWNQRRRGSVKSWGSRARLWPEVQKSSEK